MLKMIVTEAVVAKGFEDAPAIRFIDSEGGGQIANFRIGKRVYDGKAPDNHRWLNFTVKAFGGMCERIKRMKLKEGSYINIVARYDEETWTVRDSGETRTSVVLYLDEIEYASNGNGQKGSQNNSGGSAPQNAGSPPTPQGQQPHPQGQQLPQGQTPPAPAPMPSNFTGFEGYAGGGNPFF